MIAAVPVEDSLLRAAAELDAQTMVLIKVVNEDDADLWTPAVQERDAGTAAVGNDQPLFYQIQMLQQELRDLRGTVEEQAYLIQNLQRSQRSQYVDLDRRVAALAPNRPAPGPYLCQAKEILLKRRSLLRAASRLRLVCLCLNPKQMLSQRPNEKPMLRPSR